MKEIDVRGLSCPEPVLIVMDEMDADPGQDLAVLADAARSAPDRKSTRLNSSHP